MREKGHCVKALYGEGRMSGLPESYVVRDACSNCKHAEYRNVRDMAWVPYCLKYDDWGDENGKCDDWEKEE